MVSSEDPTAPAADPDDSDRAPEFRCAYCGAGTREDVVKAAFWSAQGLIAIEDIPARVCADCGEQFYSDEAAQTIEQIIHGAKSPPQREMLVPVYSLGGNVPHRGPGR